MTIFWFSLACLLQCILSCPHSQKSSCFECTSCPRQLENTGSASRLWPRWPACPELLQTRALKRCSHRVLQEKESVHSRFPLNCPDYVFAIFKVSLAFILVHWVCHNRKHGLVSLQRFVFHTGQGIQNQGAGRFGSW